MVDERAFPIALGVSDHPDTARYAAVSLQHLRDAVAEHLDADDRRTLAALLDGDGPKSLQRRADLQVRGSRTVTLGRRP